MKEWIVIKYSNSLWLILLLMQLSLLVGCKRGPDLPKTVPAEGIVTLDGKPLDQCAIMFIADTGTYNATAVSDANGKFAMKAFEEKAGAVPGSYKVEFNKTIVENKGEKKGESIVNLVQGVPKKYLSMSTSGIAITISESGNKEIKFELKTK